MKRYRVVMTGIAPEDDMIFRRIRYEITGRKKDERMPRKALPNFSFF